MRFRRLIISCAAVTLLGGCHDLGEPLPSAVRDAVGDYDLAMAITTDGDTLRADPDHVEVEGTGATCQEPNPEFFLRTIGVDGTLTLSSVDRTVSQSLFVYGTLCNDSVLTQRAVISGTYILEERYLTLTASGGFGGGTHFGSLGPDDDEITFDYPGTGYPIYSAFVFPDQMIAARTRVWRRAR
jgi:hypothetical protein